jgi:hypothetical protein
MFAFHFAMDSDPGCTIGSPIAGRSAGLTNLANVFAHELIETTTDPVDGGWWDTQGYEISDKCSWLPQTVTLSDGSNWLLQVCLNNYNQPKKKKNTTYDFEFNF